MKDQDLKQHNDVERVKNSDQSLDDLQNEIAGREVGRLERFGVGNELSDAALQKKEQKKDFMLTALAQLMQDLEYFKLYNNTSILLHDLMRMSDEALESSNTKLESLLQQRDKNLENANKLADGRVVFKSNNGDVLTENDEIITNQVLLDGVVWKDNAATYEEYVENRGAISVTRSDIDEMIHYQNDVLGNAMDRLGNADDPLSKEELKEMQQHIMDSAPSSVQITSDTMDNSSHTQNMSHQITEFKM